MAIRNNFSVLLNSKSRGIAQVFVTTWKWYKENSIFLKTDRELNTVGSGSRGRG